MKRINALLAERCPAEVEHKKLGEVGTFIRGNGLQKKDFRDQGVGCIHYGQVFTHYGTSAESTKSFVDPELAGRLKMAQPGDLVVATTSENADDLGKAVAWMGEEAVAVSGDAYVFQHSLDPRFVAFFFQTEQFHAQKRRHISGTKVKRISGADLARITIPTPPRAVQEHIVSILTAMEKLEAELEAELEARLAQYAHYRTRTLASQGAEVALGDVADFQYGLTASSSDEGEYRFVRITDIAETGTLRFGDEKRVDVVDPTTVLRHGDILVARTGNSFGKTLYVPANIEPAVFASFLIRVQIDESRLMPRYYWHFAQSDEYWRQADLLVSRAGQPQFNPNALKRITFSLPSIQEQRRAVTTLDTFDALVNDLTSGLPAEIAARRQQYQHYRDRLLTFDEASAVR